MHLIDFPLRVLRGRGQHASGLLFFLDSDSELEVTHFFAELGFNDGDLNVAGGSLASLHGRVVLARHTGNLQRQMQCFLAGT